MHEERFKNLQVVALAGGVGGARLSQGLAYLLAPDQLSIIVNTGDDFEHLGLTICPDLDTVMYTLAGLANPGTGWGVLGDTFECLAAIERCGGPAWFRLGDQDLATHLTRTHLLARGFLLTDVTRQLSTTLGVRHTILPMCDSPFRTHILTDEGDLDFQTYFVRRACHPVIQSVYWLGAEQATPTLEVNQALDNADLVILCPSNPFVSIDPILHLPGIRSRLKEHVVLALSPIIGGKVVKGPAAKMFQELGFEPSAVNVARHYVDFLTCFILDEVDMDLAGQVSDLGMTACSMPSLMPDQDERINVARKVLEFGMTLSAKTAGA